MNIVQIEDFFHPDAGYQVNILSKYFVEQGHKVSVVTSEMAKIPDYLTAFFGRDDIEAKDKDYTKKTGVNIFRVPLKGYISGRVIFDKSIFELINSLNPDVLYVHGNDTLTAIRYLMKVNKLQYPLVMDSHMLEIASVNKFSHLFRAFYKRGFTPILTKHRVPVIRTQDDPYVEKCLGIPMRQCPFIPLGSDTLLFHPDELIRKEFRQQNSIDIDDFVVVYTGKLDEAKGGRFLAKAVKERFDAKKKVVLLVVGNSTGEYSEEIEKEFKESGNRIIRFPTQKYLELAKYYQAADLSIFPRQCSLSFYDAQACGLPVVSEDNNINIDRLKYNNGYSFKTGDIEDFRRRITECVNMPEDEYRQMGNSAYSFIKAHYDYQQISRQYEEILQEEKDHFFISNISD